MDIKKIKEIINYVKENEEENFYLIGEPIYNNKCIAVEEEFELVDFIIEKIDLEGISALENKTIIENITGIKIDKYLDINGLLEILENISIIKQIEIIKNYLGYSIIKL